MADPSRRARSPSLPFLTTYPSISVPDYSNTFQDGAEAYASSHYPPNSSAYFGTCKSCYGYEGSSCGCEHGNGPFIDHTIATGSGSGRNSQHQSLRGWSSAPEYGEIWRETDHAMTRMGEQQEIEGVVEGSHDQRCKKPPETTPDPYSSTNSMAYEYQPSPVDNSEFAVNDERSRGSQDEARDDWSARWNKADVEANFHASQCLLEGCRKGYVFKTLQSYRSHLKNVHGKGINCRVLGCRHTKPFASKNDEHRHYRAKHDPDPEKSFRCDRPNCAARVRSWKRKDKLREHDRKYHMEILCHICSHYFDNEQELFAHTNLAHAWNT